MGILDDQPLDQPLDHPSGGISPLSTPPAPTTDHSRLIIPLIVLAILAGGFFGVRWWLARQQAETAQRTAAALPPQASEPLEAPPPAITLPPMDQMDPFLRQLLGALSARPELARWLATDDITRRIVFSVDQIARGVSVAKDNPTIAPPGKFAVATRNGRRTVDPESYRRYDGLAATAGSVDATAVARAYAAIRPRLNEAYRQMGHPDGDFDQTLALAIANLLDTPVPDQTPALVQGRQGLNFQYADRALESLKPAQKQLLRMGPENQRTVQAKLREIDAAIKAGR